MVIASQNRVKSTGNRSQSFVSFVILLNFVLVIAFSITRVIWFYFFFEVSLIPTLLLILG